MTEKNIADQLNNLAVPDRENALWQRIDGMLNDFPCSKDELKKQRIFSKKRIGVITAVIIILSLLMIKKKKDVLKHEERIPANRQQQLRKDSTVFYPATINESHSNIKPIFPIKPVKTDTLSAPIILPGNTVIDTLANDSSNRQTLLQVNYPDSTGFSKKDSMTSFKKPKGVRGLSDSSYRIIPVKKN